MRYKKITFVEYIKFSNIYLFKILLSIWICSVTNVRRRPKVPAAHYAVCAENCLKPQPALDGNYLRTMPLRLEKADTVFFFDLPLDICLSGAIERLGKERVDMPWKDDVLDDEFRQCIMDFAKKQLPAIHQLLESY